VIVYGKELLLYRRPEEADVHIERIERADHRQGPGLRVERAAGVATLTLDRPERNLLVPELMDALRDALLQADADDGVTAVVLAHAGETFCGGVDIGHMRASGADPVAYATSMAGLLRVFPRLGTPVIAAVGGDALALGYSLVCCVDIAICTPSARLGTFEAGVGMWPMLAQVPALRRLGARHALENILTGEPFDARRAYEVGIVNRVVEQSELDDAVTAWAERVATAGAALAPGRRSAYRMLELSFDEALDDGAAEFVKLFA
jgi:enoyl-CoA hydratase/carnithine racemase